MEPVSLYMPAAVSLIQMCNARVRYLFTYHGATHDDNDDENWVILTSMMEFSNRLSFNSLPSSSLCFSALPY
jgi:hypothetical protein